MTQVGHMMEPNRRSNNNRAADALNNANEAVLFSSQRRGRDNEREQANENQSTTAAEKSNRQILAQNSNKSK